MPTKFATTFRPAHGRVKDERPVPGAWSERFAAGTCPVWYPRRKHPSLTTPSSTDDHGRPAWLVGSTSVRNGLCSPRVLLGTTG